jgi:hypothetical protein
MPKKNVDYSNTIIYKIFCKDEIITDVYVGHTTNFIQRKYAHKITCNNLNNDLKIYNVIRSNGGWDNWDMVEIAKYCCKDVTEARIKEQNHYDILKASLNSCPPYVDIKKYFCNICNLQCICPKQYDVHINCIKHINKYNSTNSIKEIKKLEKNLSKYYCESCDFKCFQKCDWNRHITRVKHLANVNGNGEELKKLEKTFSCGCGKEFKTNAGLWKHKNKCAIKIKQEDTKNNIVFDKDLMLMLINQNRELLEIVKNYTKE